VAHEAGGRGTSARWLRRIEITFLIAGAALFVGLLREIGVRVVFDNVRMVSWGILLIVLQEVGAYVANTLGWRYAFPSPRPAIGFKDMLAARIAGDAINYVTPTAMLGGEFVRVRLLRERVTTTSAIASVTIAKLSQTAGQICFILLGLLVILDETPLPPALQRGLFVGLTTMVLLVVAMLIAQRRGLFAPLLRALQGLGLPHYVAELSGRLERLDEEIARFHLDAGWDLLRSTFFFFVGWTLGIVEIYLILYFLDVPVTFERALAIEVFSATLDAMLFFVPAKVGTQEGGKVLIFSLLGLDTGKGLSLGILRRIRELVWAGVGLLILSRLQASLRPAEQSPTLPG
jgi:putative membrane protein